MSELESTKVSNKSESMFINFISKFEDEFSRKDSRGFQILTYGLTGVGLMTALIRMRPFAKFSDPRKVPMRFIKNQTVLQGTVERIEPGKTALLMVNHKPLVNIPRFGQPKYLPVKIAGVNVTNNGISWLSTIVQGQKIEFIPLEKTNDYLNCKVNMLEENKVQLEIGKELARLGFGIVTDLPSIKNDNIKSYKNALKSAQNYAKLHRNGEWHFTIYPSIWWKIKNSMSEKLSFKKLIIRN
ncbi:hypothetical protein HCN44_010632 [Aphidius gifuensis]|uniref:Uncharacterized protein n=1 Tax=Aphidius gifuensis TaxID=684658 RepID=A0A834XW06_APHGI|nr:uncharacterized protein LOC122855740 [Aphidius gifuensis]KAF7991831.1 hypothetical protein HCN44_010632 [Aphidius gifuensis]